MRNNILYVAILALLGFSIYYFLIRPQDNPFNDRDAGFQIDTAKLGRVFIASTEGESVLLDRNAAGWVVNKQYIALPSAVNLLLGTMAEQKPLYPVTKNAHDNAIMALSTHGKKVELYGLDGKKWKVFYVGGAAVNGVGTNMLMEGASDPYVVHIQGFNGYLNPHYSTKLSDWRDRTVFNVLPDQIQSIAITYPDKPINSFILTREKDAITVKGDPEVTTKMGELNKRRIGVFMKYFTNVNCEGYLNGVPGMDSTLKEAPKLAEIEISDLQGKKHHADLYWMPVNKRSKNLVKSDEEIPDDYDADRLYAVINEGKDTALIQHMVFGKMYRKAFEFYQPDAAPAPVPEGGKQPTNVLMNRNK